MNKNKNEKDNKKEKRKKMKERKRKWVTSRGIYERVSESRKGRVKPHGNLPRGLIDEVTVSS